MTAASDMNRFPRQREIQIERRARTRLAFDTNFTRVFLNDSVRYRKAQPRPAILRTRLWRRLCGEEGVVDTPDVLLGNAGAGIGNTNVDPIAVRGHDLQRPPIRHGIASIQEQI